MPNEKKVTIQNRVMAGQKLALRYTRDRDGKPITVECDSRGCIEVSEDEAKFLARTPGWNRVGQKDPRPPVAPSAPSKPSRSRTVREGPQNAPLEDPKKAEGAEGAEAKEGEKDDDEPDVDGLRTKADAIKLASKWRKKGYEIPELDADTQKLSEMKEVLSEALFASDEDE